MTRLGDIATVRTGLVAARKKAKLDSPDKTEYEQISLRYFGAGVKLAKPEKEKDIFLSAEEIDTKYLTQEGDVVVRLRAPSSAVYIEKEDEGLLIHSLLAVICVKNNVIDPKYLAYYLNASTTQRILKQDVKGTAIPMLKTKDLEQLAITLPPIEKQKKLVRFLELADKESALLLSLANEKKQLSQTILDTIIQQNKEKN
jgi:restriction endonuclease S subunit